MELNREQIIKQMQEWCDNMCENACLKGESLNGRIYTCEICFPNTVKNALALIKELTEENKARKGLNTMLNNELRRLGEENERLKSQRYMAYPDGRLEMIPSVESVRADTVRKMQERLIAEFRKDDRMNYYIRMTLDQIAKEMEEGK